VAIAGYVECPLLGDIGRWTRKHRPSLSRTANTRLVDRDSELADLSGRLDAVRTGPGSVVVIEGPAGIGKTALLGFACTRASDQGIRVLTGRASEFEQAYPWGVVRSLFAPALGAPDGEHGGLLAGAGRLADVALGLRHAPTEGFAASPEAMGAALHGLYWALANLAGDEPLLVAVDDAQWADGPSLRWLRYLATRVEDLPVLLVIALNPAEHAGERQLPLALTTEATTLLAPAPLSTAGTRSVVDEQLGTDSGLAEACHAATGGNPFLVHAVVDELREENGRPSASALEDVPDIESVAISRAVVRRLARLPPEAGELAAAVAVWGTKPRLVQAADLADIDHDTAVRAADSLAAAALIGASEPLEFVHPVVHAAVYSSIPAHRRSLWHARAAELLEEAGAPLDAIAAHLLAVEARGDALLVDLLCEAAGNALSAGAPEAARTYLKRALAEPPADSQRAAVLRLLGLAEASLHRPEAIEHLAAALGHTDDVRDRAELTRELAVPLVHSGRVREAVSVLEHSSEELAGADRELALELEADLVNAGRLLPELRPAALARARKLRDAGLQGRTFAERIALAAVAGEGDAVVDTANDAITCARGALGEGRLLAEAGPEAPSYWYAVSGLVLAESFEPARAAADAAQADAHRKGSMLGSALAHCFRALLEHRIGGLPRAEGDFRHAVEITPSGRWAARTYALAFLIDILLDRGRQDEAARVLAASRMPDTAPPLLPFLMFQQSRGRLRIKLGEVDSGVADMRAAAKGFAAGSFGSCLWPWRSLHALELAGQGDGAQGLELAREEEALTRAFGARRAHGISLRGLGVVQGGDAGIESLREALDVLEGTPAVLERARALVDLGALLRRGGHRAEALERLRDGLDLAHRCAAGALAEQARAEMVLAGARPRRDAARGRDALTASEVRVARMAADGMTNREIAQGLFVSLRTVETHLTHVYRKLSIDSRDSLARVLEQ
jgi:DNA-binding CsgD family transcriptional regulator